MSVVHKPHILLSNKIFSVCRGFASSPQYQPLSLLFQQAVGLCDQNETSVRRESASNELNKKLLALEREVRNLRESESENGNDNRKQNEAESEKWNNLHLLFTQGKKSKKTQNRTVKRVESEKSNSLQLFKENDDEEEPKVFKELSPDMKIFIGNLYEKGYLRKANFLRRGELDFSCFDDNYGRGFIKYAAEAYGKDHQEIAKWLSGSDLKKVALFGCPSHKRKSVFLAKRLRRYFEIQENTVCDKCALKRSCKFVNQSVWKSDYKNLNLSVVMKVITSYGLGDVEAELFVPDEINVSVNRLLKEILKLSQTVL